MNLVSYLCAFIKTLFYSDEKCKEKWRIEGDASIERRKQYLEQRRQEIKRLLWETDNPTLIKFK